MPTTNYLDFKINNRPVDVDSVDSIPVSIDYEIENEDNFSEKRGAMSLDISIPATLENDKTFGTFHDQNVESDSFKNAMDCLIEANGIQLFKGKALVTSSTSQNGKPKAYKLNCYGNNGDWMIQLQDKTISDFVSAHTHIFNQATVFNTWYNFDGTSETLDYFYCPVRYAKGLTDGQMTTLDLRPSLSVYWIIWRAFQSLGYKIQSNFLDSSYFRGLVLPWTWGDFLLMDSTKLDPLKFKATGTPNPPGNPTNTGIGYWLFSGNTTSGTYTIGNGIVSGPVTHDTFELGYDSIPLGFDNSGSYSYTAGGIMQYVFLNPWASQLGVTNITFTITVPAIVYKGVGSAGCSLWIDWTISGGGGSGQAKIYDGVTDLALIQNLPVDFTVPNVIPGATIQMKLLYKTQGGTTSCIVYSRFTATVSGVGDQLEEAFLQTTAFTKAYGAVVDFKLYDEFKNYKILDLLRGLVDLFDLIPQTDPINKTVIIEPAYPYYTGNNPLNKINGYFLNSKIDWSQKQDISKELENELFSDLEQEFGMTFKDDSSDGAAKRFNDRNSVQPGSAMYLFPSRFKTGKGGNENRFFSPVMHIRMDEWKTLSEDQVAPQLIAMIPENISNTSAGTSQYKFVPKIAFARKVDLSAPAFKNGRLKFEGASYGCPEMFAVNYNKGGENDPVLSYCDQNVDSSTNPKGVIVHGLMRRFFLQRLSIVRYGKRMKAWYNLTTSDITNLFHREAIVQNNAIYHLFNIYGYKPLKDESTQCYLWKWFPVSQVDSDSCFPSISSITSGVKVAGGKDTTYNRQLVLPSDLIQ